MSLTGFGCEVLVNSQARERQGSLCFFTLHELEEPRWIDFTWKSGIQNFCPRLYQAKYPVEKERDLQTTQELPDHLHFVISNLIFPSTKNQSKKYSN